MSNIFDECPICGKHEMIVAENFGIIGSCFCKNCDKSFLLCFNCGSRNAKKKFIGVIDKGEFGTYDVHIFICQDCGIFEEKHFSTPCGLLK